MKKINKPTKQSSGNHDRLVDQFKKKKEYQDCKKKGRTKGKKIRNYCIQPATKKKKISMATTFKNSETRTKD